MNIVLVIIVIFESFLLLVLALKKKDGRIVVDEARDSWTIAITENPEKIKKKRSIKLKVEKIE